MSAIHELDETDPVLGHLLELLKAAPERDVRSARQGRSKFLAELDELFPPEPVAVGARRGRTARSTPAPADGTAELIKSLFRPPHLVWAPITVGLTLLFFLIFTGMATARVAEGALPGDALYSLKTSIEQAELAVVTDPIDEAALNLKYAERRLVEANALTTNGRIGEAQALVLESDARMKSAYATMLTVQRANPERAASLRAMVQYRLNALSGLVTNIQASAPPTLVPVLQSVMASVNSMVSAADLPMTDPTKPPAADGGAPGGGNANDDANDNSNGNDNANNNDAPANNNGDGPDNNNGGGQENNNGQGQENNNGGGQENNNGGGQENNNGGGNSDDGSDNNNGGGQEGNNGNDGGDKDDNANDGNNGGGNDDKDKDDNANDGNNGGGNDDKEKPKDAPLTDEPSALDLP